MSEPQWFRLMRGLVFYFADVFLCLILAGFPRFMAKNISHKIQKSIVKECDFMVHRFFHPFHLAYILSFLMFSCAFFFGCSGSFPVTEQAQDGYEKIRLVMTCNGGPTSMDGRVCQKFSDLVKKESGGNIQIVLFLNEQLTGGDTRKGIEMLADGSVDLGGYGAGTLSLLDERMAVASIPWSYASYQEARQVIDTTGGAYYAKLLKEQGLVYLGSTHNGMRQLTNNKRPIRTLEDMAELKIRVPGGGVHEAFIRAVGGIPVLLSWSEVPAAIRQGVVYGQDNGFVTTNSARLQEIQKYMTVWNYCYENYIFLANDHLFYSLEPKTQDLLRQKMREACDWGRDRLEQDEIRLREEFRAAGVQITELTEEELAPFRERTRPLVQKLKETYGEEACTAFQIP